MTIARKNSFGVLKQATQLTKSWIWNGSILDNAGGCMVSHFDGTNWFTASDIGGVHKLAGSISQEGIIRQFDAGRSNSATGTFNTDFHKVSAIHSDGTTAYTIGGDGKNGAIHSRVLAVDDAWTLRSTTYIGDVAGSIGAGRPVGNRRIAIDNSTNCVFIACQLKTNKYGGIAISKNGSSFTNFHSPSTFSIGRMFRSLSTSVNWSDILYATADSGTGDGANGGGSAPGVFVYTKASSTPNNSRIDEVGGGPSNIDWKDMSVVNENGKDVLYIAAGYQDGSSAGIWRCTINSDPNYWTTPDVSWKHILSVDGTGTSSDPTVDFRNIYAYRQGTSTYLIACNNPAQPGVGAKKPDNLSGTIPGTGGAKYVKEIVRSLNGQTASPIWEAITNDINISPSGIFQPMFNTNDEIWLQEAGSMNSAVNGYSFRKTIIGGPAHTIFDIDVDPITQTAVIAGKQGAWIASNLWSSNIADIVWRPFSQESGNCTNHGVDVHPIHSTAIAFSDTDRMVYSNLEGGAGQCRGVAANFSNPPIGSSTFIRQGTINQGRLLVGTDNAGGLNPARLFVSDDWASVEDRDTAPSMTLDTVATAIPANSSTPIYIVACAEWSVDGSLYRLALDDFGGRWHLKTNNDSWRKIGSVGSTSIVHSTHGEYRILANDGFRDCWVLLSGDGLYYCSDITLSNPEFRCIWTESGSDQTVEGRIAQSASTRTTLYISWGKGFQGVWKLTLADKSSYVTSGSNVVVTGSGSATNICSGSLKPGGAYGAIDVDIDESIVVCEPGYTGLSKIHYAPKNLQAFSEIGNTVFSKTCQMPHTVRKRGKHIYVGSWTSGVVHGALA